MRWRDDNITNIYDANFGLLWDVSLQSVLFDIKCFNWKAYINKSAGYTQIFAKIAYKLIKSAKADKFVPEIFFKPSNALCELLLQHNILKKIP